LKAVHSAAKEKPMNRSQLINLIVVRGVERSEQLPTPEQLQSKSTKELEEMLDRSLLAEIRSEARAQAARDPKIKERLRQADAINAESLWTQFFILNPDIADNVANRKLLFDYALSLSEDGVVRFQEMNQAAKTVSGLARQKVKLSPTAANLKQDEETLQKYCRANRLEPNTAALILLRHQYGAGFNQAEIAQAMQSGLISLVSASEENLQRWSQEDQRARQDYLMNRATPQELRAAAKAETEQHRIQAQHHAAQQQIAAREQAKAFGHPVLPEFTADGVELNSAFFRNLANTNIKLYKIFALYTALDK
jgi:hypothetical protein